MILETHSSFEQRKKHKAVFIMNTLSLVVYVLVCFLVATRLGLVNTGLCLAFYVIMRLLQKGIKITGNSIIQGILSLLVIGFAIYKLYPLVLSSNLYTRLNNNSLSFFDSNGRWDATLYILQHFTEALFGGGYFTQHYGIQQHTIIFQMYDIYGIIPFLVLTLFIILFIVKTVSVVKRKDINNRQKRFIFLTVLALLIYLMEEPVLTSNFMITCMLFLIAGFEYSLPGLGYCQSKFANSRLRVADQAAF